MRPNELWNDGVIKGRFISCNRVRIPLTVAWLGTVSMSERGADQTWQCRGLTRKADETRSNFCQDQPDGAYRTGESDEDDAMLGKSTSRIDQGRREEAE